MTKDELTAAVVKKITRNNPNIDVTPEQVKACINATMGEITSAVASGETLYLRGFGTFGPKLRAAKKARNISAGTSMEIPAQYIPDFTPADEFKRVVRESVKVANSAFDDNALY